jgi:hypothetical protein
LTITHENNNNDDPLFEDEDFLSGDFNNPEENPVNVSNLTNLDADNYEEQLKPLDIDEDAIRMGKTMGLRIGLALAQISSLFQISVGASLLITSEPTNTDSRS